MGNYTASIGSMRSIIYTYIQRDKKEEEEGTVMVHMCNPHSSENHDSQRNSSDLEILDVISLHSAYMFPKT